MSRIELGSKCVCVGCEARFYDLNRAPAICPKCAVAQPPPVPRSARAIRLPAAARRPFQRQGPVVEEEFVEPVSRTDEDDELLTDPDAEADTDDDDIDVEIEAKPEKPE